DNDGLRRVALRQLEDLGYKTLAASSAAEGLALIESDVAIDLLLTDIVMPGGMDGRELARRAAELRPSLKMLFMSGFTAAAGGVAMDASLTDRLISKPFRKPELARRLRAALETPAGEAA